MLDPLAIRVLEGEFREGDRIRVDVNENGLAFEKVGSQQPADSRQ